jgi:hypothetical protein
VRRIGILLGLVVQRRIAIRAAVTATVARDACELQSCSAANARRRHLLSTLTYR